MSEAASNEIQEIRPEQLRVVALRLQGKRWSEIAHELGVTPWTVWHWRQECPEIDELIAQESQDQLDSAKHGLADLMPRALAALRASLLATALEDGIEELRDLMLSDAPADVVQLKLDELRDKLESIRKGPSRETLDTAKYVIDTFKNGLAGPDRKGPIGRASRLSDDELRRRTIAALERERSQG